MDVVAHVVKFNSQTSGRDKLCRVFQYACKFLGHYLLTHRRDPILIEKLKILENSLSSTRKLIRFGKSLDMIQGALKSMQLTDTVLQMTSTLAKLNQAAFLFIDHFIWVGKTGLRPLNTKYWAKVSSRFWIVTIVINLMRNFYDIVTIVTTNTQPGHPPPQTSTQDSPQDSPQEPSAPQMISQAPAKSPGVDLLRITDQKFRPVLVDTIKNGSDVFLPLSSLGYVNISAGTQGILGVISSLMGILTIWEPALKLVPS